RLRAGPAIGERAADHPHLAPVAHAVAFTAAASTQSPSRARSTPPRRVVGCAPMVVHAAQLVRPARGEQVAGDAALVRELGPSTLLAVIDGLGHGPPAAEAAARAVEVLETMTPGLDPAAMVHA